MLQRQTYKHELMVDNKTGPFNRERHATKGEGGPLILDKRCGCCRSLISSLLDLEVKANRPLYSYGVTTAAAAERTLADAKAGGEYGAGI